MITRGLCRLCLILVLIACLSMSEPENDTSSGATWEGVHLGEGKKLEDLLHWAIVNSNPKDLGEQAKQANKPLHAAAEFQERQQRVAQLLKAVQEQPTEAELMVEAIAILGNASEGQQAQRDALEALQVLVEPLDNANDLHKMGGLAPVVALLGSPSAQLAAGAAAVLGTAASNNEPFQQQLMQHHPEALPALLKLVHAGSSNSGSAGGSSGVAGGGGMAVEGEERAGKAAVAGKEAEAAASSALYALAAVVRGAHSPARAVFYSAGGLRSLEALLLDEAAALRLRRKALNLIADLVYLDAGAVGAVHAGLDHSGVADALLHLLRRPRGADEDPTHELDLQEKALLALLALLEHHGTEIQAEVLQGAGNTLRGLRASLDAAAGPASGGSNESGGAGPEGGGEEWDEEDGEYVREVAGLAKQAQQAVDAQLALRQRVEL